VEVDIGSRGGSVTTWLVSHMDKEIRPKAGGKNMKVRVETRIVLPSVPLLD